ncbi:MAG: hypothetical protein LC104_22215 [Bacteroidales bacterium]|nr:hypothetical protein [Bacteroidales bacterium]
MRWIRFLVLSWGVALLTIPASAAELLPPQVEDIYKTDAPTEVLTFPDGKSAAYIRLWVDPATRSYRRALWQVGPEGPPRAREEGEPDAFSLQLSPDGKWLLFLSTRPFPDGTPAITPVPPYSDTAADIWLIPVAGGKAIPLAGPKKPYGRVITDTFYGHVAFSPDGKRLLFVADEGKDPRTESERRNNVQIVREDQGEGYEGYGPTQIWVADLLDRPQEVAATTITRLTPGDYWYGDPQWSPDGSFVVVQANRNREQESARYSINHNYDLWKIPLATRKLEQLTRNRSQGVAGSVRSSYSI